MPLDPLLQPDQDPARWNRHVAAYERVFEPLTNGFAAQALSLLEPLRGAQLLDVGAGAGGAALAAASRGALVTAVDASPAMVARLCERAGDAKQEIVASVQDGMALAFADETFDAALSNMGLMLFIDPARGAAELRRVLRPDGCVAIVTWTEPDRFELASRLRDAIAAVRGPGPAGAPPAQLRFTDPDKLRSLLDGAGFAAIGIERIQSTLDAADARTLAGSLGFAPGMASLLEGLGADRAPVLDAFASRLRADQGEGPVALEAVAHVAHARRP